MGSSGGGGDVRYPWLAAAAYLFVPGERRKTAGVHFRKAGFEALKGVNALAKPVKSSEEGSPETDERKSISLD